MRFFFKKADRILRRSEFVALSESGRKFKADLFIAVVAPGRSPVSRLGITITRRVGGAVQRNRLKRLAREFFRLHRHRFKKAWDINLIARTGAAEQTSDRVFLDLQTLFSQIMRQLEGK